MRESVGVESRAGPEGAQRPEAQHAKRRGLFRFFPSYLKERESLCLVVSPLRNAKPQLKDALGRWCGQGNGKCGD